LEGHTDQIASVYFSPDSELLASASEDKEIKIWEKAKNWMNTKTFKVGAEVHSVAFSTKGRKLASADTNGTVTLWDINTGIALKKLDDQDQKEERTGLSCVQFSPTDGSWLATAGDDGRVSLWDVGAGKRLRSFAAHDGIAFTVSFSSDGRFLASAGQDGTVKVWDLYDTKSDKPLKTFYSLNSSTAVAMFAPGEDATLAVHGYDGMLKLLDSRTWEEIMALKGGSSGFSFIAFSRDGKKIATADYSGSITIWFAATDDEVKRLASASNSKPSL
jgi:WD40 repeat protein